MEALAPEAQGAAPGKARVSNNRVAQLALQRRAARAQRLNGAEAKQAADNGVAGAGDGLPFGSQIQAAFGRHEVGHIRTQTGGPAEAASDSLGARAYAFGDRIGFRDAPDLHTAAHEAAHVVQQQNGVALAGGIGAEADVYEQHADRVADLVVSGQSAEGALSDLPGGGGSQSSVQRLPADPVEQGPEQTIEDAGYTFRKDGENFVCTDGPDGHGTVVRRTSTEAGDKKEKEERGWAMLNAKWNKEFPPTPSETIVEPAQSELVEVETSTDDGSGWGAWLGDLVSSGWNWLSGDDEKETQEDRLGESERDGERPAEPARGPNGEPIRNNLDVALELADSIDVDYEQDQGSDGSDNINRARKGETNPDAWKGEEINCGQFTVLTLAAAGWDIDDLYRDDQGRPVAYAQTKMDADGNAVITWVQLWMLINAQPEATNAVLNAQVAARGDQNPDLESDEAANWTASEVAIGGEQDAKLTRSTEQRVGHGEQKKNSIKGPTEGTYWLDTGTYWKAWDKNDTFKGRNPTGGLRDEAGNAVEPALFGVGAAVRSMGGKTIEEDGQRKPGDLQQRFNTGEDGTFSGAGHSSQLCEVVGYGVCRYDPADPTCPTLEDVDPMSSDPKDGKDTRSSDNGEYTAGWYDITKGTARWRLGPETSPENVATFTATDFKLVDANVVGDGGREAGDGIAIGADRNIEDKNKGAAFSVGRLPTSPWFDWQEDPSQTATPLSGDDSE